MARQGKYTYDECGQWLMKRVPPAIHRSSPFEPHHRIHFRTRRERRRELGSG